MSQTGTDPQDAGSMWKLVHLDPAMLGLIVSLAISIAALFGVTLTEGTAKLIAVIVALLVTLGTQIWVRARTLSKKKVLAYVPDPTDSEPAVCPGPATTSAPTIDVMSAVRTTGRI